MFATSRFIQRSVLAKTPSSNFNRFPIGSFKVQPNQTLNAFSYPNYVQTRDYAEKTQAINVKKGDIIIRKGLQSNVD